MYIYEEKDWGMHLGRKSSARHSPEGLLVEVDEQRVAWQLYAVRTSPCIPRAGNRHCAENQTEIDTVKVVTINIRNRQRIGHK